MPEATFFAPAERADATHLAAQQQVVEHENLITTVLHAVPDMMLVLNQQRQIVAVNKHLLSAFGVSNPSVLTGLRPGEAVGCIHCNEGPDGCGTAETCSTCGAVLTILASQKTECQAEGECRVIISRNGGTALDLAVTATPLNLAEYHFTIFALKDIGSEKRRQVLERTFFHDILNTIGGIKGIAYLLTDSAHLPPEDEAEYKQLVVDLSDSLAEEISQQRRLLAAEQGEYTPEMQDIDVRELLLEVCKLYGNHVRAPGRTVVLTDGPSQHLTTDRPMLRRIVGNMVLNALEATPQGGTVTVSLVTGDGDMGITVTNQGEIPKDVQLHLFKRSFSTKSATGRGIGTYSMKLFGERYLGGHVTFHCHAGVTEFSIRLPG